MTAIYEANYAAKKIDFADEGEARGAVEAHGSGYVVKFIRGYDGKDRSCKMDTFEDGAWNGVNIHNGGF